MVPDVPNHLPKSPCLTEQRSMCNLYKEIAPEITNGDANFEICSIAFFLRYLEMTLYDIFKYNSTGIKSKLVVLHFCD